jgi:hypothetical protein
MHAKYLSTGEKQHLANFALAQIAKCTPAVVPPPRLDNSNYNYSTNVILQEPRTLPHLSNLFPPHLPPWPNGRETLVLPPSPLPFLAGALGKSACLAAQELVRLGWPTFITTQQQPSSLHPNLHCLAT